MWDLLISQTCLGKTNFPQPEIFCDLCWKPFMFWKIKTSLSLSPRIYWYQHFFMQKKNCFNNIFTLKPFHLFPYLLQVFCIFRGYRKKPVTWNGLVTISCWIKYEFSKVHIMVNKVYWRCFSFIFNVCKIRKGLLNLIFQKLYRILQKWTFKNLW